MIFEVALLSLALAQTPAQPPKNPRNVEFVCPDHDRDDQHELDIIGSNGQVVQTIQLGNPPQDTDGVVRTTINVQPIAFGTYTAVVRAVANNLQSDDSEPSNTFVRVPGAPGPVNLK